MWADLKKSSRLHTYNTGTMMAVLPSIKGQGCGHFSYFIYNTYKGVVGCQVNEIQHTLTLRSTAVT